MRHIVVTGATGFIGRHLVEGLSRLTDVDLHTFDLGDPVAELNAALGKADFLFHLAGVNRPQDPREFEAVNAEFTRNILAHLKTAPGKCPMLLASSTQAALDNPYGMSKRHAEEAVTVYGEKTGARIFVYRLPNVFGKWSRPNYNSVVATLCHNAATGQPLEIHDPAREITLVHIDDVVAEFLRAMDGNPHLGIGGLPEVSRIFRVTLGDLGDRISRFPGTRITKEVPEVGDDLTRRLYSMYLSYLAPENFAYSLDVKRDPRGWLAEILRSPSMGQIFVSTTRPAVTRGNHWHHTKAEKFLVVHGDAIIRFRQINGDQVFEHFVSGANPKVVDVPPGFTHNITNIGTEDMITLFWASEPFDPDRPDTYALNV